MKKLIILLSLLTISTEKNKIYCDIKGNVKNPGVYEIKDNYTVQNIIDDAGGLKKNSYTKNINLSKKVTDEMVIYIFTSDEIKESEELKKCVCTPIYKYIECESVPEKETTTTTKPSISITKQVTTNNTTTNSTTTKSTTTISSITNSTTTSSNIIKNPTTQNQTTTRIKTTTKQDNHTSLPITSTSTTTMKIIEKTTMPIVDTLINVNTATLEELTTLKGLGEKKAESVIEYRITNGPFKTIEEIMNVSGIGKSTYEKIKDYIKV